ncbi:hypothetical protein ABI125_07460 [Tamlana crocina]
MSKSKVLIGFVLMCYMLFAIFEFSGYETVAYYLYSIMVPSITLAYLLLGNKKNSLFSLFLVFYSLSDLMGLLISSLPYDGSQMLYDFEYYFGNLLYLLSYLFLIVNISKSINIKHVVKHFKIHIVVLTALSIYLVHVLQNIIGDGLVYKSDYYFELIYNITLVVLLPMSLLNYLYRDNRKALYLFLGSLFVMFSEVMLVAHIYVKEMSILNFLSATFTLIAFYFYYQQSKFKNVGNQHKHFRVIEN